MKKNNKKEREEGIKWVTHIARSRAQSLEYLSCVCCISHSSLFHKGVFVLFGYLNILIFILYAQFYNLCVRCCWNHRRRHAMLCLFSLLPLNLNSHHLHHHDFNSFHSWYACVYEAKDFELFCSLYFCYSGC